ncbi:MAG: hypothetical protein PVG04_07610 [Anaerolineales bacterium]|jgi:hypothetical protein
MKRVRQSEFMFGILIILAALISSCGSMELGIITPETADAGLGVPEGVIIAREIVLMDLRESYGDMAPPAGLQWQGDYIEQKGLVGAGAYQFTSPPWIMNIEYPIVAPEATVYSIELTNNESDFRWEGQVDARGEITELKPARNTVRAIAWLGHVESLPEGYAQGSAFELRPEGAGVFELTAANEEVSASIAEVKDGEGPDEFVHVWGTLTCGIDAYNGCRLVADRVRSGAMITESEPVEGWEGVIYESTQPPGSGGDDYFVLTGDYPIEYGIWAQDENVRQELERLRDSGIVIRIWGELVAGIPDWAGTQIRVERYEQDASSSAQVPAAPTQAPDDRGWQTYINERYGYQIQFPPQATLEEMGIQGYTTDEQGNPLGDIPEGLQADEIFEYLRETYGENLCVQITYSLGYITISVPENAEFRYATCGRTGVGVGEMIPKEETVQIDGTEVTAEGFEFRAGGELLAEHNETFYLILPDGTRIEYGSRASEGATYQDYLNKGKPVLLEILSTYQSR